MSQVDRLYKYTMAQFARDMVEHGRFRLGTLYEYRRIEKHGIAVGDAEEGTHKTILDAKRPTSFSLQDGSPEAQYFHQHILREDQKHKDVRIVMASGAKLIANTNSEDLYVFATSLTFDLNAMHEFGYNACVAIERPDRFVQALSRSLRHVARFVGFAPVVYTNRETDYLAPHRTHPALLKGTEYAYQTEARALWQPTGKTIEPFVLTCRRAARYCSLMNPNRVRASI